MSLCSSSVSVFLFQQCFRFGTLRVKKNQFNEPAVHYGNHEKKIIFFNSFEQQKNYELKQMALRSVKERLDKLEEMRKFFLRERLLPNGSWPSLERIITILKTENR